jgi:hypothetical protein
VPWQDLLSASPRWPRPRRSRRKPALKHPVVWNNPARMLALSAECASVNVAEKSG